MPYIGEIRLMAGTVRPAGWAYCDGQLLPISENDALRWVTANAAWALGIDDRVGTLEPGKNADVVVWSANPFSVYARADQVFIDGALLYDRSNPAMRPKTDFEVGILPRGATQ